MFASFPRRLVLMALLLGFPGLPCFLPSAAGQSSPPSAAEDKVYTYVEQMPRLPGGGMEAMVAAVQQRVVLPANTSAASNRVFVRFTVGKQGQIEEADIVKGAGPVVDAAVLAAVRQLPTFQPGKQNGQPVRVSLTLAITLPNLLVTPAPPELLTQEPDESVETHTLAQESCEAQTRQQALAERRPGEADTAFLRRVLPVSFPQSNDLLAATWRPSAFGKQLFFSVRSPKGNEYGTDLFMLDPFQPNTYVVQVFSIAQADLTSLESFFFADVNQDGRKELLAISRCDLREGEVGNGFYPRVAHYQTVSFQYAGLSSTGRPQYHDEPTYHSYLDELTTADDVREALAEHRHRRKLPSRHPAVKAKK